MEARAFAAPKGLPPRRRSRLRQGFAGLRSVAAGVQVSEPRIGRKLGTRVMSLYSGTCGIHTLILERSDRKEA